MNKRHVIYCSSGPVNPFVLIVFALLAVAAFFMALPVFLAALAVFSGVAIYMTWKFRKALKDAREEMERFAGRNRTCGCGDESGLIIDITESGENGRS